MLRSGAAHLLSKGSNILIEGVGGADVTTWGRTQPSRGPITGRTCSQLTLLKDQGQEREEGVSVGTGKWALMRGLGIAQRQTRGEKQTLRDTKDTLGSSCLSLDPLTHRYHPSLSSSCRCPRLELGAGEAGVGCRAQGLEVLKALPPKNWPGSLCAL